MSYMDGTRVAAQEALGELVYELLDAHGDTQRLLEGERDDRLAWAAHLAYLRDLQRVGRECLAALEARLG